MLFLIKTIVDDTGVYLPNIGLFPQRYNIFLNFYRSLCQIDNICQGVRSQIF